MMNILDWMSQHMIATGVMSGCGLLLIWAYVRLIRLTSGKEQGRCLSCGRPLKHTSGAIVPKKAICVRCAKWGKLADNILCIVCFVLMIGLGGLWFWTREASDLVFGLLAGGYALHFRRRLQQYRHEQ
jgi:hypothetical protein